MAVIDVNCVLKSVLINIRHLHYASSDSSITKNILVIKKVYK